MRIDWLRADPFSHLPALVALALASFSLPAQAEVRLATLCSGGQLPNQNSGKIPGRDCDTACHASCSRPKRPGASGRF